MTLLKKLWRMIMSKDAIHRDFRRAYKEKRDNPIYLTPWCAWFYYMYRESEQSPYKVKHYFYDRPEGPIEYNELRSLITRWGKNARKPDDEQNPKPEREGWDYIEWHRKSYIVFLIDDLSYRFDRNEAIWFGYDDNGITKPNHTFFDAKDYDDIKLPRSGGGTDDVAAVVCINHMKKREDGRDLRDENQGFHFDFNPAVERRVTPEDGGTNMGPPVPPPE
jgi:hypothetical protein